MESLGELRLGPARSLDLLRLLQEALTNVVKHSGASRVDVTVRYVDAQLHVDVRDNGRGFDPTRPHLDREGGVGLVSLRQRAARLGSELALETALGSGLALTLAFDPTPSGSAQRQPPPLLISGTDHPAGEASLPANLSFPSSASAVGGPLRRQWLVFRAGPAQHWRPDDSSSPKNGHERAPSSGY